MAGRASDPRSQGFTDCGSMLAQPARSVAPMDNAMRSLTLRVRSVRSSLSLRERDRPTVGTAEGEAFTLIPINLSGFLHDPVSIDKTPDRSPSRRYRQ